MQDSFIEDKTNKVKVDVPVDGKTGELDFNILKSGGLIKQRQKDKFTVRLRRALRSHTVILDVKRRSRGKATGPPKGGQRGCQ